MTDDTKKEGIGFLGFVSRAMGRSLQIVILAGMILLVELVLLFGSVDVQPFRYAGF